MFLLITFLVETTCIDTLRTAALVTMTLARPLTAVVTVLCGP
jgi:hypothetical protein